MSKSQILASSIQWQKRVSFFAMLSLALQFLHNQCFVYCDTYSRFSVLKSKQKCCYNVMLTLVFLIYWAKECHLIKILECEKAHWVLSTEAVIVLVYAISM